MIARHRRAVGIAIGPDGVVALISKRDGGEGEPWSRALRPGEEWATGLADALRALRVAAPSARVLHVALMSPLAEARLVNLPAIDVSRLRPAIQRDIANYFTSVDEEQVVQLYSTDPASSGAFAPHIVTRAAARVVDEVLTAAGQSGWLVASLGPAILSWADGARAQSNSNGTRVRAQIRHADRIEVLELKGEEISRIRRFRAGSGAIRDTDDLRVLAASMEEAAVVAARFARLPDARSLWPMSLYAARDKRLWRVARRWLAAAAALLVLAAATEWSSASHVLSSVRAERAALRSRLTAALGARDSLAALNLRLASIRRFDVNAPQWSVTLAGLARSLPKDASLISLRAAGDTVVLLGDAEHATEVFTALADAKELMAVHAEAPIQQRVENGEVVAERFTIGGRLPHATDRPDSTASHASRTKGKI